jgi:peptidoglycan/LPS O-acetylase OafA/YrhL
MLRQNVGDHCSAISLLREQLRMTLSTGQRAPRPEKIHALTSLRFFAALFVVCFHALWVGSFLPSITHDSLLGRFVGLGYTSVSFFFLLSGYILGVVYLRHGGPVPLGKFFWARFARVYPLLFLTLVVDLPFFALGQIGSHGMRSDAFRVAKSFAGNALLLQAWTLQIRFLNEPSWSLSAEAIFYLIFPFLGTALWKLRGASLWVVAALFYVGGQGLVVLASHYTQSEMLKRLPLLHIPTFALGILLARWQMLRREKQADSVGKNSPTAFLVLALVTFSTAAIIYWSPQIPLFNLHDGLLAPIFLCSIWAFSHSHWQPARLLSVGWLVVLGEASYGLYLIHVPVFHLFEWLGWDRIPALFPVYLAVSISLSVLSFYYFETPVRRWILKRTKERVNETMEMASDAQ